MILTVTLNPSIDINYKVSKLEINTVNRCESVSKTAGGKGINVTRVIAQNEIDVCATGFLGGYTGEFIKNQLDKLNINHDFQRIAGETRNCIAIRHEMFQTEVLEEGPEVSDDEVKQFIAKFDSLLNKCSVVVASGSVPKSVAADTYGILAQKCLERNKKFLLDTSGISLRHALKYKPYLIKPNKSELLALIDSHELTESTLINAMFEIKKHGIPCIVVSLGEDGALALMFDTLYKIKPPKIELINAVGSGDSMMAGFAIAIEQDLNVVDTLKLGCVFGALNAMQDQTGCIDRTMINTMLTKVEISVMVG